MAVSQEIIEELENKQRLCDARGGKTLHALSADLMAESKARIAMRQEEMRSDEVRPSLSTEDVLANAPLTHEDAFRVRAILDE